MLSSLPTSSHPAPFRCIQEVLSHQTLIHLEWPVSGGQPSSLFVFGNGHIVQLFLDTQTGDPIEIAVDKSLDGKLISEVVSGNNSNNKNTKHELKEHLASPFTNSRHCRKDHRTGPLDPAPNRHPNKQLRVRRSRHPYTKSIRTVSL